ncbi:hypothetical protein TWF506_005539 [Arthrobotrys conoides]|uniref:Uncharacterized protein n=1 Tax=Arthrobotrys conoides TaxID=74498 RepID=A0AAN8S3C8_9PEZI
MAIQLTHSTFFRYSISDYWISVTTNQIPTMPSQPQSPRSNKGGSTNCSTKASSGSSLSPLAEEKSTLGSFKKVGNTSGGWVMKPVEYDPNGYGDQFAFEVVVKK